MRDGGGAWCLVLDPGNLNVIYLRVYSAPVVNHGADLIVSDREM